MKHIVGFSGGIDSQACANWVLDRFPKEDVILINSDAGGNEHPLTVEFIHWFSDHVHPVIQCKARVSDMWETPGFAERRGFVGTDELTFGKMILIKGRPPSRKAQFCTEILKLRPARAWMRENLPAGTEFRRYSGVRRDESQARRDRQAEEWDTYFDCELWHPIVDWTKDKCFADAEARAQQINPLYRLGFNRVGCAPCINSSKDDVRNWATRFPEMIDKVRRWEAESGRTFFAPMVPGLYTNNVDQVVAWSMTERGGRQMLLHVLAAPAACESRWGLCE